MPLRTSSWLCLAALLFAPSLRAQKSWQVPALTVAHRNGQSFLTWTEVTAGPAPDSYLVYASTKAIQVPQDLQQATLLAVVPRGSATSARSGTGFVLEDNKPALPAGTGLFVSTPKTSGTRYFAVTARRGTSENTWLGPNVSGGVAEQVAPSRPILQAGTAGGGDRLYAHFVGAGTNGKDPAMGNRDGAAFFFRVVHDPKTSGPRPLVVVLHPRGGSYKTIQPLPFVPKDAVQLFLDDPLEAPGHSMWFGYHEDFGSAAPQNKVAPYTETRVLWTIERLQADTTLAVDANRIYAIGASLGAIGSFGLGVRHGDRFAAVGGLDPAFGIVHPDFALRAEIAGLFGTATQNLPTTLGPRFYDLEDFTANVPTLAGPGIAPMRFFFGRADVVTGWTEKPAALRAVRDAGLPLCGYWDLRVHGGSGTWTPIEPDLLAELFELRLDRALPVFHRLSLDDDPGKGSAFDGDMIGTIGGYVRFDPASIGESATSLGFDFGLRSDSKRPDAAPASLGTVDLVLRRLQKLPVQPGSLFEVTVRRKGRSAVVESRLVRVGADALLHVTGLEVETLDRSLTAQPHVPVLPELRIDGSARLGGLLRFTALGKPNQPLYLFAGTQAVSWATPFGTWMIGDPLFLWAGNTGGQGMVEVPVRVPQDPALDQGTLLAQALIGTGLSGLASTTFWR